MGDKSVDSWLSVENDAQGPSLLTFSRDPARRSNIIPDLDLGTRIPDGVVCPISVELASVGSGIVLIRPLHRVGSVD